MYVDHTPEIVGDRLEAEASFWAEEAEKKNTTEGKTVKPAWKIKRDEKDLKRHVEDGAVVDGIFRWHSNSRIPFPDVIALLLEGGVISVDIAANSNEVREKEVEEFLAEYRERMKNHEPSNEEKYEMRAAFGEGETVVNFFTGRTYRT